MIPKIDPSKRIGFSYILFYGLVVVILLSCATVKAQDTYNPYENKIR